MLGWIPIFIRRVSGKSAVKEISDGGKGFFFDVNALKSNG